MENNDEQYIKLEKKFQDELHTQQRFYESQIELLKAKTEYEKDKLRIEYENQKSQAVKEVKEFYDVKNKTDLADQKKYYLSEIESQKNWYEEEIKKSSEKPPAGTKITIKKKLRQ